jgi:DNA-binding transcriptional LysR family regulator
MHLETLQVFCDLVETGSFSAAAAQNFITQSAVSQQVRSLEARFDRPLIERTKGNVSRRPPGQLLYKRARTSRNATATCASRCRASAAS